MKQKQIILAALAVGIVIVALVRIANWRDDVVASDDFPDGTFWVCLESECAKEFTVSIEDLAELAKSGGDPSAAPCPKCDKTHTARAAQCKSCDRFYELPSRYDPQSLCPHCGKPVTGIPVKGDPKRDTSASDTK